MKKILLAIVLGIALFTSPMAEAVLIDYDGTGNQYPTNILGYYSALPGNPVHSEGFMWLDYGGSIDPTYGPHSITAMAFAIDTNPVWIDWSEDVYVRNFWYGYGSGPFYVQGYNDEIGVFDSGFLPQNSNGMFQYFAPDVAIDRLVFNGTPNYWTYDDLCYESEGNVGCERGENPGDDNTVPEPMSMMLLGSGFVGLVGFRKRFRFNKPTE